MAPEILFAGSNSKCIYSEKTDMWALGVILHQILYMKHPFDNRTEKVITGDRAKVDKIYGQYDFLIDKCLIMSPADRISWNQFKKFYYYPIYSFNECFRIRSQL